MERKYREAICELLCHHATQDIFTQSAQGLNKLLPACLIDAVSAQSALLYLCSIDCNLPCHSKWAA